MSFEEWAIEAYKMRNIDEMEWDEIIPHFREMFAGKTDLQIYEKIRRKIKQIPASEKSEVETDEQNVNSVLTAKNDNADVTLKTFEPTEDWVKENLNKGIHIDDYSFDEQTKIADIVCRLKDDGYQITIDCGIIKICKDIVINEPQVFQPKPWNGCEVIRFGLVSDTHINSKYTQLTHLHDFYDKCVQEGIDTVYHAGDIDDGEEMRMGHKYECYTQGADDHVKEIIRVYPKRDGITTYFITGNHDASIIKRCGYDIGYAIAKERKDMIYLGQSIADIMLTPNCKFRLQHPWDGTAYSISYKPMKIIEAMQGGEKPNLIAIGNYHKAEYLPYRNVHSLQAGCFKSGTYITMGDGSIKKICDIKVGDKVVSHDGKTHKVTETFKRKYSGNFFKLKYGRNSDWQSLIATEEHPVYTIRSGERSWLPIKDICEGDLVMVKANKCEICGGKIPYYHKLCINCNPAFRTTKSIEESTHGRIVKKRLTSGAEKHFQKDILPFCQSKEQEGWRMVPVSSKVIPDAIGFKDGKVVLFEVESSHGVLLNYKKHKYDNADIIKFADEIEWVDCKPHKEQPRSAYYDYGDDGFVWVPVISNSIHISPKRNAKSCSVYNFEVEDSHSYVAKNVAVHNCFQAITPFMQNKGISAYMGGWIIELQVEKTTGYIKSIKQQFIPYYTAIKDDYKNWANFPGVV